MTLRNVKFFGPKTQADQPTGFFDLDGAKNLRIENCEFEFTAGDAIKAINTDKYVYIRNTAFIEGGSFHIAGSDDIHLINNEMWTHSTSSATDVSGEIKGFENVIRRGNYVGANATLDFDTASIKPRQSQLFETGYAVEQQLKQNLDGGTINAYLDRHELSQPGNASAKQYTRLYEDTVAIDPSVAGGVRVDLSNVSIDDSADARIYLEVAENPNQNIFNNDNKFSIQIRGTGTTQIAAKSGGTSDATSNTSNDNAWVESLGIIDLHWDGSTVYGIISDDTATSTRVDEQVSGQYPSTDLYLKIVAADEDGSFGNAVSFDVDRISFR